MNLLNYMEIDNLKMIKQQFVDLQELVIKILQLQQNKKEEQQKKILKEILGCQIQKATKGAYPGIGAEERGQGEAIASSMLEMASLTVPTISIIIGEGSSGGALALGLGNKVLMLENAIYSILSPEGYASILWKDASRAKEAAEKMKLTAKDLKEMNVIDEIIKEPEIEESEACEVVSQNLKNEILKAIKKYAKMKPEDIKEERYQKFRNMGEFQIL